MHSIANFRNALDTRRDEQARLHVAMTQYVPSQQNLQDFESLKRYLATAGLNQGNQAMVNQQLADLQNTANVLTQRANELKSGINATSST